MRHVHYFGLGIFVTTLFVHWGRHTPLTSLGMPASSLFRLSAISFLCIGWVCVGFAWVIFGVGQNVTFSPALEKAVCFFAPAIVAGAVFYTNIARNAVGGPGFMPRLIVAGIAVVLALIALRIMFRILR